MLYIDYILLLILGFYLKVVSLGMQSGLMRVSESFDRIPFIKTSHFLSWVSLLLALFVAWKVGIAFRMEVISKKRMIWLLIGPCLLGLFTRFIV
jgi:hypothetical protein